MIYIVNIIMNSNLYVSFFFFFGKNISVMQQKYSSIENNPISGIC